MKRIGGVMVSLLASSVVDRGFESRSGQTNDYKIGIWFFFLRQARSIKEKLKSDDWFIWFRGLLYGLVSPLDSSWSWVGFFLWSVDIWWEFYLQIFPVVV